MILLAILIVALNEVIKNIKIKTTRLLVVLIFSDIIYVLFLSCGLNWVKIYCVTISNTLLYVPSGSL